MGIGLRIALGGLGRGIQQGVDDYSKEQQRVQSEQLANSRYEEQKRRDEMNEAIAISREGGVVGGLPAGYNPDGSVQGGKSAMRPGSYVGQSTASTEAPYATETSSSRPMKKIGTLHDQDVWVPSDGLSPSAYEQKVARDQKKADFEAALPKRVESVRGYKWTHPSPGNIAALSDPQSGDNVYEMLNRNEMEADPAYQQRKVDQATKIFAGELPGKKELKAAPGSSNNGTVTQDRIRLNQERTGVNQQILQTTQQINATKRDQKNKPYISHRDSAGFAHRQSENAAELAPLDKRRDSLVHVGDSLNAAFQKLGTTATGTSASPVPLQAAPYKGVQLPASPDWAHADPAAQQQLQEAQLLYHRNQHHPDAYSAYSEAIQDIIRQYHVPQISQK